MAQSLRSQQNGVGGYWDSYLAGVKSCRFPCFDGESECANRTASIKIELEQSQGLRALFVKDRATLPGVIRTAWALVLGCYVGSEDVCFGYSEQPQGPSGAIPDGLKAGPPTMHIARMSFNETASLVKLVEKAKVDYTRCLSYQHESPMRAVEALQSSENRLFNTAIRTWRDTTKGMPDDFVSSRDPLDLACLEQVSFQGLLRKFSSSI